MRAPGKDRTDERLTRGIEQHGMAGLPDRAVGPGALGTGALYFDQGRRASNASQIYLRFANLRFPAVARGVDLQIGRMGYLSGSEAPSGVPKIETVKRQRLDARPVSYTHLTLPTNREV